MRLKGQHPRQGLRLKSFGQFFDVLNVKKVFDVFDVSKTHSVKIQNVTLHMTVLRFDGGENIEK